MDNLSIANLLVETADLLEISAGDPFRIRSYRRAAEAVESTTIQLSKLAAEDPKKLLDIPGIGKGMAANIQEIEKTGTLPLREELLTKYKASMLELLKLPAWAPSLSPSSGKSSRSPTSTSSKPPSPPASSKSSHASEPRPPKSSKKASPNIARTPAASASTTPRPPPKKSPPTSSNSPESPPSPPPDHSAAAATPSATSTSSPPALAAMKAK